MLHPQLGLYQQFSGTRRRGSQWLSRMALVDPLEFERRCAEEMQLSGWIAQFTKSTGDQGADVVADKKGIKVVLQGKLYSKTVGNKAVKEMLAEKTHLSANFAAVVSNSSYTRSAKEWCSPDAIPERGNSFRRNTSAAVRSVLCHRCPPHASHWLGFRCGPQQSVQLWELDLCTPPLVITDEDKRNWNLSTKSTAIGSPIDAKPADLRTIARAASLPAGLNQTLRDMVIRSGRPLCDDY
jgi:hypothetical protein